MRIALNAMGVITLPKTVSRALVLALKEYPYIEKLFLVGDAVATGNELKRLDFKMRGSRFSTPRKLSP